MLTSARLESDCGGRGVAVRRERRWPRLVTDSSSVQGESGIAYFQVSFHFGLVREANDNILLTLTIPYATE